VKRKLLVAIAVLFALVGVLLTLPPVQARVKAIFVLAEALGVDVPRPFAANVVRREVELNGVTGDLYDPGVEAPAVLFVPGAAREGKDDERAVRAARALARTERLVFVPTLELSERRFEEQDIDRLVAATEELRDRTGEPVAMLGISYGGSFALLAAADDRLETDVGMVATFGAYFDLVGVIQAVTTGVSLVEGERVPYEPHLEARRILTRVTLERLPERARPPVRRAIKGDLDPRLLPPAGRAVYDLLTNEDPTRTHELARKLPERVAEPLRDFSPSEAAAGIEAPVVAMHSRDDPAVPYGEALRLEGGLHARLFTVSVFEHVDLDTGDVKGSWTSVLGEMIKAWRFTAALISSQE
jgi:pimeloyl-ACP methyl ester carboxylesterase